MFHVTSGTGASCIYPLLGATMNGWFFLATEVDDICFNYAKKNVEQNNMSDLIKGGSGLKQQLVCTLTGTCLSVFKKRCNPLDKFACAHK